MRIKPAAFGVLAVVCILHPLTRFFESPTFETARAVDIVLVFVAGMMTGALIVALRFRHRRPEASGDADESR